MRVALLGTRGVPARYSGFETCVEEVGRRLVGRGHEVLVYCRYRGQRQRTHLGMRLVNLPALRLKATETLTHTFVSALDVAWRDVDAAIVFNAANAALLPLLKGRGIPTAVHVDGLEWKRDKWSELGKRYYLASERLAVRWADRLIADSRAIQSYYLQRYAAATDYLTYGAPILDASPPARLSSIGLSAHRYHLVVARLEPENNVHLMVEGYVHSRARLPLVVVGGAPYGARYIESLKAMADERVTFLGGVWDQDLLNELYAHCLGYLHGHSVGGTNPSLLRAMGAAAPVTAIDVAFNREVLGDSGVFFRSAADVGPALERAEADPEGARARGRQAQARAAARYDWDDVAAGYEALCQALVAGRRSSSAPVEQPGRRAA